MAETGQPSKYDGAEEDHRHAKFSAAKHHFFLAHVRIRTVEK
jgi:hypothetical protein